jgi:DNA-binding NarL/FixJ family response regulator
VIDNGTKLARLLLADDHAAMLGQTIRHLEGEFEIVGTVSTGLDLVRVASQLDPDVMVLDITMPGLDGIQSAVQLHQAGCRAKLVFLSVHEDPDYLRAALEAGGAAYVTKTRLASDLIPAIHAVLAGQSFVSPTFAEGDELSTKQRHDHFRPRKTQAQPNQTKDKHI